MLVPLFSDQLTVVLLSSSCFKISFSVQNVMMQQLVAYVLKDTTVYKMLVVNIPWTDWTLASKSL